MLEPMDLYIRQIRFKKGGQLEDYVASLPLIQLLDDRGLHQVEYRQTDHYRLTRRFLENPEKMLKDLLL